MGGFGVNCDDLAPHGVGLHPIACAKSAKLSGYGVQFSIKAGSSWN